VQQESVTELLTLGQIEWLAGVAAMSAVVVAYRAWRRREDRRRPANTLQELSAQDLSIFDDEVASGGFEIDPIREAEVYLAYGNRKQALALLQKAVLADPDRQDIREKLQEVQDAPAP